MGIKIFKRFWNGFLKTLGLRKSVTSKLKLILEYIIECDKDYILKRELENEFNKNFTSVRQHFEDYDFIEKSYHFIGKTKSEICYKFDMSKVFAEAIKLSIILSENEHKALSVFFQYLSVIVSIILISITLSATSSSNYFSEGQLNLAQSQLNLEQLESSGQLKISEYYVFRYRDSNRTPELRFCLTNIGNTPSGKIDFDFHSQGVRYYGRQMESLSGKSFQCYLFNVSKSLKDESNRTLNLTVSCNNCLNSENDWLHIS